MIRCKLTLRNSLRNVKGFKFSDKSGVQDLR